MSIENEIWKTITSARCVLLTSHERVDGDGIGSELALMHMARGAGVECVIINDEAIPVEYEFLPGAEKICKISDGRQDEFDLVVSLDSASLERLRKVKDRLPKGVKIINIDHHISNTQYGDINWVGHEASSTGEIIFNLAQANGIAITPEIATCLYTAIITDTGRFCYSNTSSHTHLAAAELVRCGASPSEISRQIYRAERSNVLRLRQLALATLELSADGQIACIDVAAEMHRQTGTKYQDTHDFVDMPKSIKGVEVALLFREIAEDGKTRVSMRSEGRIDMNTLAQKFGGGGHKRAAGCTIDGSIEHAHKCILPVVEKLLETQGQNEKEQ